MVDNIDANLAKGTSTIIKGLTRVLYSHWSSNNTILSLEIRQNSQLIQICAN
jgi:hypothetical protein